MPSAPRACGLRRAPAVGGCDLGVEVAVMGTEVSRMQKDISDVKDSVDRLHDEVNEIRGTTQMLLNERRGESDETRKALASISEQIGRLDHPITEIPSVQDELDAWRNRAVNILMISLCILLTLGIGMFVGKELLSHDAASLAKDALGHAP